MTSYSRSPKRRDQLIAGVAIAAITAGVIGMATYSPVMAKTAPANAKIMALIINSRRSSNMISDKRRSLL